MKDADSQPKRRNSRTDSHELKLAGIDYNIGPDAEDRLRRIFAILAQDTRCVLPAPTRFNLPHSYYSET